MSLKNLTTRISNSNRKKRIIFVSLIFAISIIALFVVIINFRSNIVFFYSPKELREADVLIKTQDKIIRAGGLVKKNSIKKINNLETEFTVTDMQDDLIVNYKGLVPDLFRENQGVVAKGKFDQLNNKFLASELLVKHDEKYMPPEVAKSISRK